MIVYNLPEFKVPKLEKPKKIILQFQKDKLFWLLIIVILLSSVFGFLAGSIAGSHSYVRVADYLDKMGLGVNQPTIAEKGIYVPQTSHEQAIIKAVKQASPAVVSIIVIKDLPATEQYYYSPFDSFGPFFEFEIPLYGQEGAERQQTSGGTGFIVSEDGMVLTNKHVVLDDEAEYVVLTSDGERFSAQVLARDPIQDIAILSIKQEGEELRSFSSVKLGDSEKIQIGQTAIAIGNVLGKYQNTISTGVISGLGRTITASGGGFYETLEDIIQTDTAINKGNSGGPLLNLRGEVIGINTAIDVEGQNIGFSIPINKAKIGIEQVKETGEIVYPFLGVRYIVINKQIQEDNDLLVDYGALITGDRDNLAIVKGSAADKAGLKEGDILLELEGEKITTNNSLAKIIVKYSPEDEVSFKFLREKEEKTISIVLGKRTE